MKLSRRSFIAFLGSALGIGVVSYGLGALKPRPEIFRTITQIISRTETNTVFRRVVITPSEIDFKTSTHETIVIEFIGFDPHSFPYTENGYTFASNIAVKFLDKNSQLVEIRTRRIRDASDRIRFDFDKEIFIGHVTKGELCLSIEAPEIGYETCVCIRILDSPKQTGVGKRTLVYSNGVMIVFSEVLRAGTTRVRTNNKGPKAPASFSVIAPYYGIRTTAKYSRPLYAIIPYDEDYISSVHKLAVMRFDWKKRSWEDVTYSVNKKDKLVCGKVDRLSTFCLMRRE